jgi:mRNA-degrading endonuclease RelE of RelBE toxin-antitoxin system
MGTFDIFSSEPEATPEAARVALESVAARLRDAILRCAPKPLLAFLWHQVSVHHGSTGEGPVTADVEQIDVAMAMEYVHAVLSGYAPHAWGTDTSVDAMHGVLRDMADVRCASMQYCYLVNQEHREGEFAHHSGELHFRALSNWIFSRAYRYGVLESEFLKFALAPHDGALRQAYGVDAATIADGLQAAVTALLQPRQAARVDLNNVTRTSGLPAELLDDLSYQPGDNTEFFRAGLLSGTPLLTLPGRLKPLVRLDDGHYACDPYFLRDSAYRAIQRGLRRRIPDYDATWTKQQTAATEAGFTRIFDRQLAGADTLSSVFYKEAGTGKWCELDLLVRLDDTLFVVEVKGGVMPTHSPELDFDKYGKKVEQLIQEAYDQGKRFLEYANSRPEVMLYQVDKNNKKNKKPVGKLRLGDYRLVFPIGLTIESFVPFSASSKHLPGIVPILGRFPFIAMAIDDLFILNRFLPTAGELTHYLAARQRLAARKALILVDEADHLGLYVSHKRYDIAVDFIASQGIERFVHETAAQPVNAYFNRPDWEQASPPRQRFAKHFSRILQVLDTSRRRGFLRTDAIIRDLGEAVCEQLEASIESGLPHLAAAPHRRILFHGNRPCVVCLQRDGHVDVLEEHRRAAEDVAHASATNSCPLLIVLVRDGIICDAWGVNCHPISDPVSAPAKPSLDAHAGSA